MCSPRSGKGATVWMRSIAPIISLRSCRSKTCAGDAEDRVVNWTLPDWYQRSASEQGQDHEGDGVHPNANGILVLADTIRTRFAQRLAGACHWCRHAPARRKKHADRLLTWSGHGEPIILHFHVTGR